MKKAICLLLAAALLTGLLSGCSGKKLTMNWVKDRFKSITSGDDAESTPADADDKAPNRETPVALATESSNELTDYGLAYQAEYGLDPYDCLSLNNRVILSFLYESLFVVNSRYAAEPVLATGYDVSGDGLSTTVYLRRGVLFHDGREMTAKDVIYSISQARGSDYYGSRFYAVTDVTAQDDYTLVMTTSVAYECLPLLLDIPIVRDTSADAKPEPPEAEAPEGAESSEAAESPEDEEAIPEESTDAPAEGSAEKPAEEHTEAPKEDETPPAPEEPAQPVGTGPYRYASATRLERFDGWWQEGAPLADFPYISLYTAETSAEIRDHFEYEDINLVQTDPNSSAYVNFHNDYELWTAPTTVMQYIGYNLNSNVFSNYGLRSAITYAIDRETLVTEQAGGFATASSLPCPPQAPFYDARQANSYSYSPSRFHEQLESASVKDMDGDGVLDLYVTSLGYAVPVSGTMLVCSSSYQRVQTASAIVSALNALGFDLMLKSVDTSEFRQLLALGSFDLYYGEVRLSANFDLSSFFRFGGSLAYGALADNYMENLCHLALANNGNNYNLYERLCGRGYITPVLFKNYAIYTTRGSVADPSGYLDWFLPQRPTTEQE